MSVTPVRGTPEVSSNPSADSTGGSTSATTEVPPPTASFSALSEKLRTSAPSDIQCALFCGGRRCKYESEKKWSADEMAVRGIYSHWITNDIIAMSRPNNLSILKHDVIHNFKELGIKTIINLQEPGEHASCGPALHSSGFSYDPAIFMRNDIYFYNFQWRDYSSGDTPAILNMVKVICFAATEGKVAIHCHAGLGRTGVLISCFLLFHYRCKPQEAIAYVRSKRPFAVQMRSQIDSVYTFYQHITPLFTVYPDIRAKDSKFTLSQYIKRQQVLLHGYEARHLKLIPKIVYMICERLLQLCDRDSVSSPGLKRTASVDSPVSHIAINFQLKQSESFLHHFYTSSSSSIDRSDSRSSFPLGASSSSQSSTRDSSSTCSASNGHRPLHSPHSSTPDTLYTDLCFSSGSKSLTSVQSEVLPPVEEDSPLSRTANVRKNTGIESQDNSSSNSSTSVIEKYSSPPSETDAKSSTEIDNLLLRASEIIERASISEQQNDRSEDLEITAANDSLSQGAKTSSIPLFDAGEVASILTQEYQVQTPEFLVHFFRYQKEINNSPGAWHRLSREEDVHILSALLWFWFESLEEPVLDRQTLVHVVLRADKPIDALMRLSPESRILIEYLIRFVARLRPESETLVDLLIRRLVAAITHQMIRVPKRLEAGMSDNRDRGSEELNARHKRLIPGLRNEWSEMRKGTTERTLTLFKTFYSMLLS